MYSKINKKSSNIVAPKCKTLQHIRKYHNKNNHEDINYIDETNDPYYWLTDKNNPEVIEYLKAENQYTQAIMQDCAELQQKLYNEFKSRIQETDYTAPWLYGDYKYYSRNEENKEYDIFCRIDKNLDIDKNFSEEQILLDENILAEDFEFFSTGDIEVSTCHKYIAYTVDTTGDECYSLYIKDIESNKTYDLNISNIASDLVWSADSKSIIYLNLDDSLRPHQVRFCDFSNYLNNNNTNTYEIYTEQDERFWLGIDRTRTGSYILIEAHSKISSEIYYIDAYDLSDKTKESIKSIKPREPNVEYHAEHYINPVDYQNYKPNSSIFYILINSKDKPNYELYKLNLDNDHWELLIEHDINTKLSGIDCFANFCVLFTKKDGLNNLNIINNYHFDNIERFNIEHHLNEEIYTIEDYYNENFNTNSYYFEYESLATPDSVYCVNINSNIKSQIKPNSNSKSSINNYSLELVKQDEVLNNYNKDDYVSERILVKIKDQDKHIPISLVYNKNTYKKDGKHSLLLYGYGSYGISIDPYFSYSRISLLDRGIAYAIAHIRGGGDLGETWYHDGKLDKKNNTFNDFIHSAEYLIENKYTNSGKLIIHGGSAGGMLIGNVINQRPDLFKIAIAEVPFVDCLNTMLDPNLPLTVTEYEEWGNPTEDYNIYKYIKSYAPYENITKQNYPNLLINNSLEDIRVSYWEAAKWSAKLRANKQDSNTLLLKTQMTAGHGGASGRYQALHEVAFNYSFILKYLAE